MAKKAISDTTTYLLEMEEGGQKKLTIPADWTLTFGALIPGSQSNQGKLGLRLWKGKQQKAVFQGVRAFRGLSMQIEERITTTKQETYRKGDGAQAKAVVVEATVHEWVNPDEPRPQKEGSKAAEPERLRVINLD